VHDRTSGRSPDLSLYAENNRRVFSFEAFPRFRAVAQDGEEKNQKAFTVAGPCGNFTRFPILLLPEKRQQAPEAKTVLLRRRLIYTERCVMEMLRRSVYENCSIIASFGN